MFSSRPYTYYTMPCRLCIFPLLSKSPLGWLIEDKPQRANDIDTGLMFPVSDQVDKFLWHKKNSPEQIQFRAQGKGSKGLSRALILSLNLSKVLRLDEHLNTLILLSVV